MSYGIPERSVLIALMTLEGETANSELKKRFRLDLKKNKRDRLIKDGLITSRKKPGYGAAWFHTLTDKGWDWLEKELEEEIPPRAGSAGGALYAILHSLKPILQRENRTLRSFFDATSRGAPSTSKSQHDIPAQVTQAYKKLAKGRGSWVELIDLRKELKGIPRKKLDQTLLELYNDRKINLTLHDQQNDLTEAHEQAALRLGVDSMHLIAIR